MLQNSLMPQLDDEGQQFIFQQDGAPTHWHDEVLRYLNEHLPRRCIGRSEDTDIIICARRLLTLPSATLY